jgi:hypothetical protein
MALWRVERRECGGESDGVREISCVEEGENFCTVRTVRDKKIIAGSSFGAGRRAVGGRKEE